MVVQAWRRHGAVRRIATVVGVLFLAEIGLGVLGLVYGDAVFLQVLHVATAAALWALLVVLAMLAAKA